MVTVIPLTVTESVLERVTERTRTSIFRVVQFDRLRFHSFCISHIYTSLNHKRLVYIPYYIIGFASSGTSTLTVKWEGLEGRVKGIWSARVVVVGESRASIKYMNACPKAVEYILGTIRKHVNILISVQQFDWQVIDQQQWFVRPVVQNIFTVWNIHDDAGREMETEGGWWPKWTTQCGAKLERKVGSILTLLCVSKLFGVVHFYEVSYIARRPFQSDLAFFSLPDLYAYRMTLWHWFIN